MHGGDILKFAGDAIIVCWSPTRELGIEVCEGGREGVSIRVNSDGPVPGSCWLGFARRVDDRVPARVTVRAIVNIRVKTWVSGWRKRVYGWGQGQGSVKTIIVARYVSREGLSLGGRKYV